MFPKLRLQLDKANGLKPVTIYHSIHHKGSRFRLSTGLQVLPDQFDKEKQEVKRTRVNYQDFNRQLAKQKNELERVCLLLVEKGKPINRETVGARLSFATTNPRTIPQNDFSLLAFFDAFILDYGRDKEERTLKGYQTAKHHLKKYIEATGNAASFATFDADFYHLFRKFLNLPDNTFGQHIKNLKIFAKWSQEKGLFESEAWKKWKVTEEDKEQFFLYPDEVATLENLEVDERLTKVKDLFLLACYTGLSFSDLSQLSPRHYTGQTIEKHRHKTKALLQIPVIPKAAAILKKYWEAGKPLPTISNQKGNQYLKEIAEKAELNRPFNYVQKKGRELTETAIPAFKMISWHTARHTFITNCIHMGVNPEAVRRIVGHSTFKMMEKYIQNNPEFLKKEIKKIV